MSEKPKHTGELYTEGLARMAERLEITLDEAAEVAIKDLKGGHDRPIHERLTLEALERLKAKPE